jgi:hypothetical protein
MEGVDGVGNAKGSCEQFFDLIFVCQICLHSDNILILGSFRLNDIRKDEAQVGRSLVVLEFFCDLRFGLHQPW